METLVQFNLALEKEELDLDLDLVNTAVPIWVATEIIKVFKTNQD